ncbi:hypothetical protein GQ53DRAFT_532090 [Thozetella sp. PMI_491]|nr:hypothetical protein GQ53DRAFT_532090 [Thozetella sp. PMI_491]
MAVKDDDIYHPTEGLVLSRPRAHYRTSVVPTHWQLRSLIGSEKNHLIYFPGGASNTHIKCLDTATNECETIKLLSFEPRCLVAQNGWLCCGGETGDFSAIRLGQPIDQADSGDASGFADPLLRFQLSPPDVDSSQTDGFSLRPRPSQPRLAQSKTFGKERVNCITLWFPPTWIEPSKGAYREPVAVLANNDKNVTTVSLQTEEALDDIAYPDCVNRAVMSPDGQFLIAVCDDPYLYVHQRTKTSGTESRRSGPSYSWREIRKIHLKGQIVGDRSDNRGSFALCFSGTGGLLAVGTQYGRISIFDVDALAEPGTDALLTTFKSSRSDLEIGAVRDMAFAPGPVDLLAWSEDRGHIGVADLRNGFSSRQILYLENQDDYEHLDTVTKSPAGTSNSFIDPRLLDSTNSGHDALSSTFASTLDLSFDTTRNHTRELLERYSNQLSSSTSPLTPEETRVLEALQEHRRRREQRAAERAAARASGQSSVAPRLPWIERSLRSNPGAESTGTRASERGPASSRVVSDIVNSVREQLYDAESRQPASRSVRDILGTVRDQLRTTEERLQGLQASIREREARGEQQPETERSPSRRTPISRLLAGYATPPHASSGGAWPDLDTLYNLSAENSSTTLRNLRDSAIVDAESRLRRERMNRLVRDFSLAHPSSRHPSMLRERSDPHDTAGLSWSEDGRILFVGAVNGIYEFKVNMIRRRTYPSITCR